MLAAFRYRDFRLFWSGLMISQVGFWMQTLGHGWLVVQLAMADGSPELAPLYLGLVGLSRALPGLSLSLIAGVIVDRLSRRGLLVTAQATSGLLSAILATLVVLDAATIWSVLLIGAAGSAAFAFDAPARQSMVLRIVPSQDLMSAIGLNAAAFNGPQIIGPALGGLLIGPLGVAGLFYASALGYFAVVAALLLMRTIPKSPPSAGSVLDSLKEGLAFMRSDPVVRWVILLAAAAALLARPYVQLFPAVATNVLHVGAEELSWLMTANGCGAFVGALAIAALGDAVARGRLLLLFTGAVGVSLTLFSLQSELPYAMATTLVTGSAVMLFMGLTNTILQTSSPDRLRGRVMSAYTFIFLGLMPIGQLVLGILGSFVGVNIALRIGAVATVLLVAIVYIKGGPLRRLTSDRRPHMHPHALGVLASLD